MHLRLWRPRYLFPFWQTLVKLQVRNLSTSLAGANIELCLYSVRKNLIRHFPGVSLANLNVTSLEHLGSPLAKANLVSLGNLENSNATSAKQSLLNLTAISSNFCHGTEQVCLRTWRCTIGLLMASHFQWLGWLLKFNALQWYLMASDNVVIWHYGIMAMWQKYLMAYINMSPLQVESCKSMAGTCDTLSDGFFPLRLVDTKLFQKCTEKYIFRSHVLFNCDEITSW